MLVTACQMFELLVITLRKEGILLSVDLSCTSKDVVALLASA